MQLYSANSSTSIHKISLPCQLRNYLFTFWLYLYHDFFFDVFLCLKKFFPASKASSLLTPGIICNPFTGFISRNAQGLWSGVISKKTLEHLINLSSFFPCLAWLMFLKHSRFVVLTKLPSCLLQVSHIFQDLLIKSFYQTCFQTFWEWSRTSEGFYHLYYPTLYHRAKEYTPNVHSCFYFWHFCPLYFCCLPGL